MVIFFRLIWCLPIFPSILKIPSASKVIKLMPFFWNTIALQGQLYGNLQEGSIAILKNPYLFSYPGYSEMLVGYVDLTRNSNNKENNPNITVLEYIHNQPGYNNKVAAFCSWDVFDFIINEERSGIYVSAGMEPYEKGRKNPKIGLLILI